MEIVITPSKNNNKKFDALIDGKKTVSFGQKGASDYTKHKDKERKERYIARHKKNEDHGLSGVRTAGFWSANLLWNKKTLKESIDDINKKFKSLNVKMK
jgi:hypothetical protein